VVLRAGDPRRPQETPGDPGEISGGAAELSAEMCHALIATEMAGDGSNSTQPFLGVANLTILDPWVVPAAEWSRYHGPS